MNRLVFQLHGGCIRITAPCAFVCRYFFLMLPISHNKRCRYENHKHNMCHFEWMISNWTSSENGFSLFRLSVMKVSREESYWKYDGLLETTANILSKVPDMSSSDENQLPDFSEGNTIKELSLSLSLSMRITRKARVRHDYDKRDILHCFIEGFLFRGAWLNKAMMTMTTHE